MTEEQGSRPGRTAVYLGIPRRGSAGLDEPLSERGFVCDSRGASSLVEVTTTWLAANLFKGCPLGCSYCFRYRWHPDREPVELATVERAVAELLDHGQFRAHTTPLTVNISSTDAMHPRVRASTLGVMRRLDQLRLRNPFGVTTKLPIPDSALNEWSSFAFLRPVVLVSYAAMPVDVEPVPRAPRVATLKRSRAHGLPTIVLFKPIVKGWNTEPEQLREVFEVARNADAIVYGGLRLDADIAAAIQRAGRSVPFDPANGWGTRVLAQETEETLLAAHAATCPEVPLYRHTSCAVSYVMARPNYNFLFRAPAENCVASCPLEQMARCQSLE